MSLTSRIKVGELISIGCEHASNCNTSGITIYEGSNIIGRTHLAAVDKRVSRRHLSLQASIDGSIEVVVEGPNPVVVRSEGGMKKVSSKERAGILNGDILELIPGDHMFKYVYTNNNKESSKTVIKAESIELTKGKRIAEFCNSNAKRNRQILEDEMLCRNLQEKWNQEDAVSLAASKLLPRSASISGSSEKKGFIHQSEFSPMNFRLMRVQGLPAWANSSTVTIQDIIQGDVLVAVLSNYMVDIDWLLSACPCLRKVPHVLVVHGEGSASMEHMKGSRPASWVLHKPPLPISYGTHHSKAMLLVYPRGIRIVVHTANLIHVDWNNKTQGLWMQDFPWKDADNLTRDSSFERDLVDYLMTLKWPAFNANIPCLGNVTVNPEFFKRFNYTSAVVRLIASVPGYHSGHNLRRWGHMKMRRVLEEFSFDKEFCKSPLVYQFSSLGSLDDKWLVEFTSSMSAGRLDDGTPLGAGKPLIIWPTVEDVRCSIEGYAAGNAIPSPQKNVEREFLRKYWARWKADHVGRCRAMPHIKTFARYSGDSLAWFLLTSANLSKAAWGALQKNNTQLMIRSYELGVLFLPATTQFGKPFSCTEKHSAEQDQHCIGKVKTKLVTACWNGNVEDPSSKYVHLPVPYRLPPQPYYSQDVPWSWDRRYTTKDVYGEVWPRHVKLYTSDES